MLRAALKKNIASEGFVVVGFPRNIQQVQCFQERIQCSSPPVTVLLDCSELELARNLGQRRNRLDDNKVDFISLNTTTLLNISFINKIMIDTRGPLPTLSMTVISYQVSYKMD